MAMRGILNITTTLYRELLKNGQFSLQKHMAMANSKFSTKPMFIINNTVQGEKPLSTTYG